MNRLDQQRAAAAREHNRLRRLAGSNGAAAVAQLRAGDPHQRAANLARIAAACYFEALDGRLHACRRISDSPAYQVAP